MMVIGEQLVVTELSRIWTLHGGDDPQECRDDYFADVALTGNLLQVQEGSSRLHLSASCNIVKYINFIFFKVSNNQPPGR